MVHKKDDEEAFDFGLFYTNQPKEGLFGFVDLFSDMLCFTHGGTRISQQHHPRFRVCVFEVDDKYVRSDCGIADGKEEPTIMFEDEAYSSQNLHHPRIVENLRGPRDLQ